MFGKKTRLNSLAARKRLLIAESEINRAVLLKNWQEISSHVSNLVAQASSIKTSASSLVRLLAVMTAFTNRKADPAPVKASWFQRLSRGVKLGAALWRVFRSKHAREEESD